MSNMNHQYLSTLFYSDETINEVLKKHSIIRLDENTYTNLIGESDYDYIDSYDKDDVYKLIKIKENGYEDYLVAIYDASLIEVTYSKNLGVSGEYLVDMAKREDAIVAINGGGIIGFTNNKLFLGKVSEKKYYR